MHGMQLETRFGQPFAEGPNRVGVTVIEMRARREHFERLESVRRDMDEMLAVQTLFVKQMRRDAELAIGHRWIVL
jgi:hypothetical protein